MIYIILWLKVIDFAQRAQSHRLCAAGLYDEGVGYTDWEFNQIISNQELLNATDFYIDGAKINTKDVIQKVEKSK